MAGWPDIQSALSDGLAAARHAKASGQPVVGFLSNNVPLELIHAAGAFALQLPAAPLPATPRADAFMEASFDPQARTALELLLRGELHLLDLLVLPRSVDSFHRLYYYLCELRRSFGLESELPEPYLYDVLQTPWQSSQRYSAASTRDFAERLSVLTGRALNDVALSNSVATYNRVRTGLARMTALRRRDPRRLSGERALQAFSVAQRLEPARFSAALEAWLDSLQLTAASSGEPSARVLLVGSAHDTPALHRLIAAAGGEVVCDYHAGGELMFGAPLDEHCAPFEAVCRHYSQHSFSTRTFGDPAAELRRHAADSGATVALFYFHAEDDALCWDEPVQRRALELPAWSLHAQPYAADPALLPRLREFFTSRSSQP